MNVAFTLGRIALVVLFVFSGVGKLLDIPGTAEMLQSKVAIPAALADLTSQIAATVGMPIYQILAIVLGVIEVGCALLIALNILTRTAAVVLLIYTAVTTYYFHDFWNMTDADRSSNLIAALKNLSIIGAFLMLAAWPRRWGAAEASASERHEHL
jgi:putative oxidoreductase